MIKAYQLLVSSKRVASNASITAILLQTNAESDLPKNQVNLLLQEDQLLHKDHRVACYSRHISCCSSITELHMLLLVLTPYHQLVHNLTSQKISSKVVDLGILVAGQQQKSCIRCFHYCNPTTNQCKNMISQKIKLTCYSRKTSCCTKIIVASVTSSLDYLPPISAEFDLLENFKYSC